MMDGNTQFTPEASNRWAEIPERFKLLLNNVWCVGCRKATNIVNYSGKMEQDDIVLEGFCIHCGGPVVRVVEGS